MEWGKTIMDDWCLTCGGLIAETGKAYHYAGKFCQCYEPPRIRKRVRASEQKDYCPYVDAMDNKPKEDNDD